MDFLDGMNPSQQAAVRHLDGPLLVLAGAGSGKTRVITHRIAHLIASHQVPPSAILAVTFTNKAAGEMKERVARLLGASLSSSSPVVSTFHSFCVRLLRRDGAPLADLRPGFTTAYSIYDEDDQLAVVKSVCRDNGLDESFMAYRTILSRISGAKNSKQSPEDLARSSQDARIRRLAALYEQYEDRLRQSNALDFDDLLLWAVRLLEYDEQVRAAYNRRFRYVMVDEYQDTNRSQYELVRLLTEEHQNICVVGDEDQSIYGWRGANIRNILDFEKDFPNVTVIRLEQNYRSTKTILEAASALVAHNKARIGKWLWTEGGQGEPIGLYEAEDGEAEALFIADTVQRLLAANPQDRVAVLYRTNAQSRQFEEAFRRYGTKYLVVGGFSFYQRAEVKDLLAYLRLMISPGDSVSLLRVINTPARGIGRTTVDQLQRFARENGLSLWTAICRMIEQRRLGARAEAALGAFRRLMESLAAASAGQPLQAVLDAILEQTGYRRMLREDESPEGQARLENVNELLNAAAEAAERGEGILEFLDHAALVAETDGLDEKAAVSLLTLHNTKGLEFPIVFIAGMEEGLCPHSRSLSTDAMIEEERRLCYVGMTRAQKRLYLTWAKARRRFGAWEPEQCTPSRFLHEIPPEHTELLNPRLGHRHLDLRGESWEVRQAAARATYTGKTYNSLENIAQFFAERGMVRPGPASPGPVAPASPPPAAALKTGTRKKTLVGKTILHPRFGPGKVLREEGDGEDAKLTVSFPRWGLRKIIAKFASIEIQE